MRDVLHDAIDAQEELGERAQLVVERLRSKLPDVVASVIAAMPADEFDGADGADIVEDALALIAAAAEAELADLTTEAVQAGASIARRRARVGDVGGSL